MAVKFKTNRLLQISPRSLCLTGGSRDKQSNDVSQILRGAILVVRATKFETKSAITRFVKQQI